MLLALVLSGCGSTTKYTLNIVVEGSGVVTPASGTNAGIMGDGKGDNDTELHPVTCVNWRDAMVWCNALTEYYNAQNASGLDYVYTDGVNIVRDSRNAATCDNVTAVAGAKGFRLPTSGEWELAARYTDGVTWLNGAYASGATADFQNTEATDVVAWYAGNSGYNTHVVGTRDANGLNVHDMSGSVWEWCFDMYPLTTNRVGRGGSWFDEAMYLQVGYVAFDSSFNLGNILGFRIVKTE